jgi:hypothetical protein
MTATLARPLIDPSERVTEGTCPSTSCRAVYELTPAGQMPEHPRANEWAPRRCPCSGWLARNPQRRKHFYVEGVRFL